MCNSISKTNKQIIENEIETEDIVTGSLDAKSLYPSLRMGETSKIMLEGVKNSKLELKSFDWHEAA